MSPQRVTPGECTRRRFDPRHNTVVVHHARADIGPYPPTQQPSLSCGARNYEHSLALLSGKPVESRLTARGTLIQRPSHVQKYQWRRCTYTCASALRALIRVWGHSMQTCAGVRCLTPNKIKETAASESSQASVAFMRHRKRGSTSWKAP